MERSTFDEIHKKISQVELHPLLCAVAELTCDARLLDPKFAPRLHSKMISVPANGGVLPEVEAEARILLAQALHSYFQGERILPVECQLDKAEMINFLSGDSVEHTALLRHELGETESVSWSIDELAPERTFRVAIIGAGLSGIAMAKKLKQSGIEFDMYEMLPSAGGTWRENRYPGCRLDTSTLAYSYSFEQKIFWEHHFALREEFENYYQEIIQKEDILSNINFNTRVTDAVFSEDDYSWELTFFNLEDRVAGKATYQCVISAVGVLNEPKFPDIPGIGTFEGHKVHSAKWSESIDFAGKDVCLIGTGASAYQLGPAIAKETKSLTIFQRSAPWGLPTPNYHQETSQSLRELLISLPNFNRWLRLWEFWHFTIGKYAMTKVDPEWMQTELGKKGLSVSEANEKLRQSLTEFIKNQYPNNPELALLATPDYPVGTKRMLRDNGVWAEMLQRENVTLVPEGVQQISSDSVYGSGGTVCNPDLLIFATGFNATNYLGTMNVIGREGVSLRSFWGEEPRAYLGLSIPNFPNFFTIMGPNTGLVAVGSQTFMSECGINYIMESIKYLLTEKISAIEPTSEAYREWIEQVDEKNKSMVWGVAKSNSWYQNQDGVVIASWPFPLLDYWKLTRSLDLGKLQISKEESLSR